MSVCVRNLIPAVASSWLFVCGQFSSSLTEAAPVLPDEEVYQRAKIEFIDGNFYKPQESGTNELTFTLAPLIIQEVKGSESPIHPRDQFGSMSSSNGVVTFD